MRAKSSGLCGSSYSRQFVADAHCQNRKCQPVGRMSPLHPMMVDTRSAAIAGKAKVTRIIEFPSNLLSMQSLWPIGHVRSYGEPCHLQVWSAFGLSDIPRCPDDVRSSGATETSRRRVDTSGFDNGHRRRIDANNLIRKAHYFSPSL